MGLLADLRFVMRRLTRQDRRFALFACATMSLGLWAATFIFSVANGLLLRSLPYRDAGALVRIAASHPETRRLNRGLSEAAVERVRALPAVEAAAPFQSRGLNVNIDGEPQRVAGAATRPELFAVLDVRPVAGRIFSRDEAGRGDPVAVVSEALIQRVHGTAARAIGRTVTIDGRPHTIVGVMAARVRFPEVAQVWIPLPPTPRTASADGELALVVRTRGNAGVLREQLNTAASALAGAGAERGWVLGTQSLNPLQAEGLAPLVLTAVAAATLLLLVVSANVAALMLARGIARQAEFAVMAALGASRTRLVLQLLMESAVIAGVAAGLAILLTAWTLGFVPRALPVAELPEWIQFGMDGRVLLFAVAAAVIGTFTIGLVPALQSTVRDVAGAIRTGSRTVAGGSGTRLQRVLVGVQLLVATVLLIGGGLMLRSYVALARLDPGYDPAGVYMLETELPSARYGDPASIGGFHGNLVEKLSGSPDIRAAAVAGGPGTRGGTQGSGLFADVQLPGGATSTVRLEQVVVSSGFFEALGVPLRLGRGFAANEAADAAIVTEAFARRYWPSVHALDQTITVRTAAGARPVRVVGVAGDMRDPFVGEGSAAPAQPRLYLPIAFGISRSATVYVRSGTAAGESAARTMREAVRAIDPDQAVWATTSLTDFAAVARAPVKWFGYLLGACAVIAIVVASIGLYGVVAYGIRRRQREFAIRATFGASPAQVLGLIVLDGVRPTLVGLALGIAGGAVLGRALATLLYGVPAFDFLVTGVTVAVLLTAVLSATVLPAIGLSRTEPSALLRGD